MTREEILTALKEVFSVVKPSINLDNVGFESNLASELGVDSLSMLLMSLAIENKFGFQFKTQTVFEKVGDVVDYIKQATD